MDENEIRRNMEHEYMEDLLIQEEENRSGTETYDKMLLMKKL